MGSWFGGSESKSYSTSIMQDQRVTAEEVEKVVQKSLNLKKSAIDV